jgi:aerobic carbon-monoxide dehydrogenase medium subunit
MNTALRRRGPLTPALGRVVWRGARQGASAEGSIPNMRYEAPQTFEAAVALLAAASGEARVLAGGTDLLVQLRSGLIEPELVVDIKRIPEVHEIRAEQGGFRIGAAVTGAELGEHPEVKKMWPGVVEAAQLIGSTQVQGRATMVGNMCNASPAADSVPAMIAAGAIVRIVGPGGQRELPVEEMCIAPGQTALEKGEVVASVLLPARPPRTGDAYLRFIPRTEMDIAVVGCGVCLTLGEDGACTAARVGLGAVAPRPLLVTEAADALIGTRVDADALERLAQAASAACQPIDDKRGTKEYRIKVAGVLARRAAAMALARAREN